MPTRRSGDSAAHRRMLCAVGRLSAAALAAKHPDSRIALAASGVHDWAATRATGWPRLPRPTLRLLEASLEQVSRAVGMQPPGGALTSSGGGGGGGVTAGSAGQDAGAPRDDPAAQLAAANVAMDALHRVSFRALKCAVQLGLSSIDPGTVHLSCTNAMHVRCCRASCICCAECHAC